jgi:hypothetical protein
MCKDDINSHDSLSINEVVEDQICHSNFHQFTMLQNIFMQPWVKVNISHLYLFMNVKAKIFDLYNHVHGDTFCLFAVLELPSNICGCLFPEISI